MNISEFHKDESSSITSVESKLLRLINKQAYSDLDIWNIINTSRRVLYLNNNNNNNKRFIAQQITKESNYRTKLKVI